ncbi:hypothetical protein BGS_1026 [Beggiatoa sp. SS]|nr:hypothetical protein BGS_1026 [Beggiatoa sp. SS]
MSLSFQRLCLLNRLDTLSSRVPVHKPFATLYRLLQCRLTLVYLAGLLGFKASKNRITSFCRISGVLKDFVPYQETIGLSNGGHLLTLPFPFLRAILPGIGD